MWAGQLRTRYHHNRGWSAVYMFGMFGIISWNLMAYVCSYIVFDRFPQIV